MSYVTNLALWLQYFNKLTYLLTYPIGNGDQNIAYDTHFVNQFIMSKFIFVVIIDHCSMI